MIDHTKFNFYEGLFWIILGLGCVALSRRINKKYKKLTFASGVLLILFGVSDFIELTIGGFLSSGQEWLYVWKVACVLGFITMLGWYFKLRSIE